MVPTRFNSPWEHSCRLVAGVSFATKVQTAALEEVALLALYKHVQSGPDRLCLDGDDPR